MKLSDFTSLMLLGLFSLAIGCAGEAPPEEIPDLHSVEITVVQGGAPLEGASVQLVPQDEANRWASGGSTNAEGEANIVTMGKYDGVPAGSYKVTVDKVVNEDAGAALDDPSAPLVSNSHRVVAAEFNHAETTPAEITVTTDGATQETIDVGEAVQEEIPELN